MKLEPISSILANYENIANKSVQRHSEHTNKQLKQENGANVSLSLEAHQRLQEEQKINDTKQTSLRLENSNGTTVFKFYDKETNELVKQVPAEEAIERYERVQRYLERITKDLF